MPSQQETELHRYAETDNAVTATASPKNHPDPIYFTDEAPTFEVTVTNGLERELGDDSKLAWYISIGEKTPAQEGRLEVSLEPGETKVYELDIEKLSYEGHASISFSTGGLRNPTGPVAKLKPGRSHKPGKESAYSFRVYDRETYERTHLKPLRYQKITIFLSLLIVALGGLQLYFTLIQ